MISIADLADGAAHTPLLGAGGAMVDPLLLVDLGGGVDAARLGRAIQNARHCDRLLIGVGDRVCAERIELVEALDLSVLGHATGGRAFVVAADPCAHADVLAAAAARNPQAAVALGRVLRLTAAMPVAAALEVESYAYSTLLGGAEHASWLAGQRPRGQPPNVPDPVLVARRHDELTVTLNRPERRNAYGRLLRDALVAALEVARRDDGVRQVVLCGAGPVFCSGGDLAEFGTAPDLATAHFVRMTGGAARLIHDLRDRIEVRVHGACVGAGVELPAFAGWVVADPRTTFRLPESAMGLIPGAGGTVSLPRRIGRWRTLDLALSGATLTAPAALAWGLVDKVAVSAR